MDCHLSSWWTIFLNRGEANSIRRLEVRHVRLLQDLAYALMHGIGQNGSLEAAGEMGHKG